MGNWGIGLYQEGFTLDIKIKYKYKLHMGKSDIEAIKEILEEYKDFLRDAQYVPLFWFAIADTQWNLGRLKEDVKNEALKYIEQGTDLERWKKDEKLYKKRKDVLEKLKEKLLSPQPKEKKISKYRLYRCEWSNGDTFAYQLKSEFAKENNLDGIYLIIQKTGEQEYYIGHIIPLVRIKLTKDKVIPKTEKEINDLEYIQTDACPFERRLWGFSADKPIEEQIAGKTFETDEYGLLPEYILSLIITSKNMYKNQLIYLGKYENIEPPKKEFIPLNEASLPLVEWKELEEEVIKMYFGHNKRKYQLYNKKENNQKNNPKLLKVIKQELEKWDPIKFIKNEENKYDLEIVIISTLLKNDFNSTELSNIIYKVFVKMFDKNMFEDLEELKKVCDYISKIIVEKIKQFN